MVLRVEVGRDNQQPEAAAAQTEVARSAVAAVQMEAEDRTTEEVVPMDAEVESYLAAEAVATEEEVGSNL
jgi:hypothetical protein